MKKKFIETPHCTSRLHCQACRTDSVFREGMDRVFEWDGECPRGYTADNLPDPLEKPAPQPRKPPPPLPPLHVRVKNFAASMLQVLEEHKKTGALVVPTEVFEERFKICRADRCGKFNDKKMACAECGCSFKGKLPLAAMACPVDPEEYWGKYISEEHENEGE